MIQQFLRPRAWQLLNFSIQYNRMGAIPGLTFHCRSPDMTRFRLALSLILSLVVLAVVAVQPLAQRP